VRSLVGRFLEHSRIFYFANGGDEEVYLASADWMPRNLYERVEVMFPVNDPMLCNRVRHEILDAYLADTVKARVLRKDGSYVRAWQAAGKRNIPVPGFSAQDFLVALAEGKQTIEAIPGLPEPKPRRITARKERRVS
jgi:polyphosphate kinase